MEVLFPPQVKWNLFTTVCRVMFFDNLHVPKALCGSVFDSALTACLHFKTEYLSLIFSSFIFLILADFELL